MFNEIKKYTQKVLKSLSKDEENKLLSSIENLFSLIKSFKLYEAFKLSIKYAYDGYLQGNLLASNIFFDIFCIYVFGCITFVCLLLSLINPIDSFGYFFVIFCMLLLFFLLISLCLSSTSTQSLKIPEPRDSLETFEKKYFTLPNE